MSRRGAPQAASDSRTTVGAARICVVYHERQRLTRAVVSVRGQEDPAMTRPLALAAALMLVPTAALPGLKRDCKLGCAALVAAECDGLSARKAQKRCAKARLSECRRAARRVAKPNRGSAIAAFCAAPITTTTIGLPASTTTTTTAPRPTTTTTTLPAIPNVRGTWFFDGSLVSDTCGLNEFSFSSAIRVTSQVGTDLAGNLGSGVIPWQGIVLDDGWGGLTEIRCSESCCAQSLFAVLGFTSVADASFELAFDCTALGTCSIQYVGTIERQ
jgi:hypothetical protein